MNIDEKNLKKKKKEKKPNPTMYKKNYIPWKGGIFPKYV